MRSSSRVDIIRRTQIVKFAPEQRAHACSCHVRHMAACQRKLSVNRVVLCSLSLFCIQMDTHTLPGIQMT